MLRASILIQPNICVDLGAHDVPEPSCDIASAKSVVECMSGFGSCAALDGAADASGMSICGIAVDGISAGSVADAAGRGATAAEPVGRGCGFAVMPGIGAIVMPGIGAIVGLADAAMTGSDIDATNEKAATDAVAVMKTI